MKRICLLFSFLTGILYQGDPLFAIINYSMVPSASVYTPLSGGVNIPDLSAGSDLTVTTPLPIGFNFVFDGVTYTQFQMSDNGYIHLGNNLGTTGYGNASGDEIIPNDFSDATGSTPGINTMRPYIAPLWEELAIANIGGNCSYKLTGSAGTRTLTIEWNKVSWRAPTGGDQVSFQVILYEGTNIIDFLYQADAAALGTLPTASIGLGGISNGDYYSLNNSGASPVASKTVNTTNISVKPATGQRYRWTNLGALPIQLLAFSGKNWHNGNLLEWKTASEKDNDYFTVERSTDASSFEALNTIKGAGSTSQGMSYSYLDVQLPAMPGLLYYRLKQTDLGHTSSYSPIIVIGNGAADKPPVLYFDEASGSLVVSYYFKDVGLYRLQVTDLAGRPVASGAFDNNAAGQAAITLALPFAGPGIYMVHLAAPDSHMISQTKFIK